MRTKNREEVEKRKTEIVAIAKEIIVEEGISNLSIRKIAKEWGQSIGTIYYYFASKEEILIAMIQTEYQQIVTIVTQNIERDIEEKMANTMYQYMYFMIEKYDIFKSISHFENQEIQERLSIFTQHKNAYRNSFQALYSILIEGCKKGCFTIENIELRTQIIISSAQGIIQRVAIEKPKNKQEILKEYSKMMLQSIKGEKR